MKIKKYSISPFYWLAISIIAMGGILASYKPVYSQSPSPTPSPASITPQPSLQWSQPIALSDPLVKSWFPDVATSVDGSVHVVWASTSQSGAAGADVVIPAQAAEEAGGFDVVMYTSSQNGMVWATPNDIAAIPQTGGSEATRPSLYIDLYDRLHLTYRGMLVYYSNAPVDFAALAAYWSPGFVINYNQVAYFSRLTQDRFGMLHLIYTENSPSAECEICYHLYYRRSTDNGSTWSESAEISQGIEGVAKPQILIDAENNLYIVYEKGIGGSYGHLDDPTSVMMVTSNDGGLTWNNPQVISGEVENAKNITIGLDGKGQLVTAWLNTVLDVMEYRVSADQGKSWTEPAPIPGVLGGWSLYNTPLDDYSMVTDSAGVIHFAAVGRTPETKASLSLLHLTWDGVTWSTPNVVVTLTGDAPEWPRLAIGSGNQVHLVWFVRDAAHLWDSDRGLYRVWYAQAISSAPQMKATPLPEYSPTPTSPALVVAFETPTPMPTSTPNPVLQQIPPPSGSIYNETDEVILIALSLIPALLILTGLVIVIRLRQR